METIYLNSNKVKPHYLFYYKNDEAVDDLLFHHPFNFEPELIQKSKNEVIIYFTHYDVRCFKTSGDFARFKGYRCWQVLIEDELYDEIFAENSKYEDYIYDILEPSMNVSAICGGHITRVEKYYTNPILQEVTNGNK